VLQQAYLGRWLGAGGKEEVDVMKVLDRAETMPPSKQIFRIICQRE